MTDVTLSEPRIRVESTPILLYSCVHARTVRGAEARVLRPAQYLFQANFVTGLP